MSGDHAKKEMVTGEKPATSHRKAPSGESGNKLKGSPSHNKSHRSGEKKKKMKKVVYYETDSSSPSTSGSDALPVLNSAADRLRCLDQILGARLEAEGSKLCRAVIEYVLTCFRSHDPAISLEPVIAGPVADTEDAAWEGV